MCSHMAVLFDDSILYIVSFPWAGCLSWDWKRKLKNTCFCGLESLRTPCMSDFLFQALKYRNWLHSKRILNSNTKDYFIAFPQGAQVVCHLDANIPRVKAVLFPFNRRTNWDLVRLVSYTHIQIETAQIETGWSLGFKFCVLLTKPLPSLLSLSVDASRLPQNIAVKTCLWLH